MLLSDSEIGKPSDYSFLWESLVLKNESNRVLSKEEVIGRIEKRAVELLTSFEDLLEEYDLIEFCEVNAELIWQATLCYFADVVRIKQFHPIDHIAREKVYAYEAFWLLRHHPIQILTQNEIETLDGFSRLEGKDEQLVYVNEFLVVRWLIDRIANKLYHDTRPLIQVDDFVIKILNSPYAKSIAQKMFYNFRYRMYTAETILLTLEAMLGTTGLILDVT